MEEKTKKYAGGSTGRDIIDDVVEANKERNIDVYTDAKNMPPYYGAVSIGEDPVSLTTIKNRKNFVQSSMIGDIISSAENMQLSSDNAEIRRLIGEELNVEKVHPAIVKLAKACIAGSYSPSEDFTKAVSNFAKQLLTDAAHLCLPLDAYAENDAQMIIINELNEYLKDLCTRNDIPFGEVVVVKSRGKRTLRECIKDAEG